MRNRVCLSVLAASMTLLLTGCDHATTTAGPVTPPDPKLATARVSPDEATIVIPVGHRSSWHWHNATTLNGRREYQWEVAMPAGAFGFSLFKPDGAREKEGQLKELLEAGQASVWEGTGPGSGQMVAGAPVVAKAGADGASVIITLFNGDQLRKLFAQRPPTIELVTRAPGLNDQRYTIPVTYSGK